MSYLDRLKTKILEDGPRSDATKVSKGPFVPFVAPVSDAFGEISASSINGNALEAANDVIKPASADVRIEWVLGKLRAKPGSRYAMEIHEDIDPEDVILTLAIAGRAACEIRIPKSRYDAFALLDLIEKHTNPETLQ